MNIHNFYHLSKQNKGLHKKGGPTETNSLIIDSTPILTVKEHCT